MGNSDRSSRGKGKATLLTVRGCTSPESCAVVFDPSSIICEHTAYLRYGRICHISPPVANRPIVSPLGLTRVAILANLSPDSGNLPNVESVWLQIFLFGDLANFCHFLKTFGSKCFGLAKCMT